LYGGVFTLDGSSGGDFFGTMKYFRSDEDSMGEMDEYLSKNGYWGGTTAKNFNVAWTNLENRRTAETNGAEQGLRMVEISEARSNKNWLVDRQKEAFGNDITFTQATEAESFNLKRIGNAYYTTVSYKESFTSINYNGQYFKHATVELTSIGIMFNVRGKAGEFQKSSVAKQSLANAFDYARAALNRDLVDSDFDSSRDAKIKFMSYLNYGLGIQFSEPAVARNKPFNEVIPTTVTLKWVPVIY